MRPVVLFLIMAFSFYCQAKAQELTIKSFTELTNDITARSNPRNDLNGNPCALVKVRMAMSEAIFKGMIIGNINSDEVEYFVYMPAGAKKLTIAAPNYLAIDVNFADYGISALTSKTTYQLVVGTNSNLEADHSKGKLQLGWIVLNSNPQEADVYINDSYIGKTPIGNCKKEYGHYKYRIEMNNYHTAEGEFELNSSKYQKVIQLKPAFGAVSIKGNLTGITVFIDGHKENVPSSGIIDNVSSGKHMLTIQKDKYAPLKQTIVVNDGESTIVNANLQASFSQITIKSIKDAQIYIDGTFKGNTSYSEEMQEGFHDIEVRMAHFKTVSKQIEVKAGVNQTIQIEPSPIVCSLDVISDPINATVYIDGKECGETPCTIEDMMEGDHKIEVNLNGYATIQKTINLKNNADNTLSFSLEKITQTNNHEYVDLGLSVKWATMNVGATEVAGSKINAHTGQLDCYGEYYAWAEVEPKDSYTWSNLKYCVEPNDKAFSKYEATDAKQKVIIELMDDAANVNWGGNWRMPTAYEQTELRNNCYWLWTTNYEGSDVKGYIIYRVKDESDKGKMNFPGSLAIPKGSYSISDPHIFLPAAGLRNDSEKSFSNIGNYGNYSSSTLSQSSSRNINMMEFNSNIHYFNEAPRNYGRPIRAVCK